MQKELAHLAKLLNPKKRKAVLRYARYLLLKQKLRNLPAPIHFSVLAVLCMFVLLPVMPLHPMAIPVVIGGGLSGGLLILVGCHVSAQSSQK